MRSDVDSLELERIKVNTAILEKKTSVRACISLGYVSDAHRGIEKAPAGFQI